MDIITEDDLCEAEVVIINEKTKEINILDKDYNTILDKMANPVDFQKELAVDLKQIIDKRKEIEMEDNGFISETTRRWMSDYNNILNNIQKNLYGDKSTHLNVHMVGHSAIASKIRKFKKK